MEKPMEEYLGDGVYASYDGYHIIRFHTKMLEMRKERLNREG